MDGRAEAPAAGTVLNALATGTGSAFAIEKYVRASVTLEGEAGAVTGTVEGAPDADTRLIERAAELVIDEFGGDMGATVETDADVPMASGLKSSSAAANAVVLATLDALDAIEDVTRERAARIGVAAARDAGVTVTGAFDDASASMLGGVTVTNNDEDALLVRDEVDWDVVIWTPPEQSFSADADVDRCRRVAPMAELVEELALSGRYQTAMTVNGFAFAAALEFPGAPMVDALPAADGVSLSGTGPSYVAVGDGDALEAVADAWAERPGTVIETTTQTEGARPV